MRCGRRVFMWKIRRDSAKQEDGPIIGALQRTQVFMPRESSKDRRIRWRQVLDAETMKWSKKTCDDLIPELHETQAYQVEFESKLYQVEVVLLENTGEYVHVMIAVDDGSLPASILPSTDSFIRQKLTDSAAIDRHKP